MDEARRNLQQMAEDGLLPPEQAAFVMKDADSITSVAGPPVLERRSSSINQILIADGVGRIKIDNPLGDLHVTWPSREGVEVDVERRVGAREGAAFDALLRQVRVVDIREGGTLKLRVHAPEAPSDVQVEAAAKVRVPSGVRVDGSSAAALELRGLRADGSWSADGPTRVIDHVGRLRLHTDSGDIEAEDCQGNLDLHVENGNLRVERCSGSLQLSCFNGEVLLDDVTGDVRVSSPDGDVRVHELSGFLNVRVGCGDVDLTAVCATEIDVQVASGSIRFSGTVMPGGTVRLRTASGDVTVGLACDARAEIEATAPDGVTCDVPLAQGAESAAGSLRGVIGSADARIVASTSEGSVHVGWRS